MSESHKKSNRRIIWVEADRFDNKPNKSPWIEMSRVLKIKGFDVLLLTGYEFMPYLQGGMSIVSLHVWNIPFLFRLALILRLMMWVLKYARHDDIVIVKPDTLLIAPLLCMAGIKNLHLDIRTLPLRENKSIKNRLDNYIFWSFSLRKFRKFAKSFSFITERLEKEVESEFGEIFHDYVIWQSSVNLNLFRPIEITRDASLGNKYNIFYHGSIYSSRGVDKVVEAMAMLHQAYKGKIHLTIVGPEYGSLRLNDIIEEHGLSEAVTVAGLVPYELIPQQIAKADCCICPLPNLLEWNVSSPLKVFEYLACGKPVILTPIPAHKDVAENQSFIVWAAGYEAANFRDAIEYAYENRNTLLDAAKMARGFIREKYDWEYQGQKLAAYFEKRYF